MLQRGNDLARDAVYVDSAWTRAAVSVDAGTLQVDPTFNPPNFNYAIYAAPLYFVNTAISTDLVIVVDEGNEVFGLNAADGGVVWHRTPLISAADDGSGGTGMSCGNIGPPLGITGTPVIDPVSRRMFLGAVTLDKSGNGDHLIYALSLDDGSTVPGWPIDLNTLSATLLDGSTFDFYSPDNNQRGALTLVNGVVYVPYGGLYGDCGGYHGAVIGIDANDPTTITAYATTVHQAGIWAPGGIASDGTNLFVATGNGDGNGEGPGAATWSGGDAIIKLGPTATFSNKTTDWFAPTNYQNLDFADQDLGSVAPILFDYDDARTGLRHLVYDMGKTDQSFLVDQENMGGFNGQISGATYMLHNQQEDRFGTNVVYHTALGTYVSYNGSCSLAGGGTGALEVLQVVPSTATTPITTKKAWCIPNNDNQAPLVSTPDGTSDMIVWTIAGGNLYGYDGDTGTQIAELDNLGPIQYWSTPIIAKGRMFMATNGTVTAVVP